MDLINYLFVIGSCLIVVSFLMVRYYASRRTSITIQLVSTVSFAACLSGIFLLPIDLSLNVHHIDEDGQNDDYGDGGDNGKDGSYNETLLPWHILFWTTSALAWVILPIIKGMLLSGEFTFSKQFRDGIRRRLRLVLIFVLILIVAIIWLAIYMHSFDVLPILITLANTYGLLIVSLLLGYGLVALPRSLWRQASPEHELRRAQIMAISADEALFEAVWELQDVEYAIDFAVSRIVDLDEYSPDDLYYKRCVNHLLQQKNETAELTPELHLRRLPANERKYECEYQESNLRLSKSDDSNEGDMPSMEELVSLNRRLKQAQENLYNTEIRWNSIVERSVYFNSVLRKWTGKMALVKHLRTISIRFVAIILGLLSCVILWSEATLSSPYDLSPFALVQKSLSDENGEGSFNLLFQIAALIPLLYMSICVSSSIFKLTMFGPFALRGYRQSHGAALVFNAQILARLQFPLGYNYLLMLKYVDSSQCAFSAFIGQMAVVPLFGTTFSVYAPLLIIALCVFTLFNIYPKIMNLLSMEHEDAILLGDQETIDAKVSEGISLLRQRNVEADKTCEMPMVKERIRADDEMML